LRLSSRLRIDGATNGPRNRVNAEALCIQIGNLFPFGPREVRISWHGNISFLCDNKRISNPLAMLHFAFEFTYDSKENR
jgi:hypothetical protein